MRTTRAVAIGVIAVAALSVATTPGAAADVDVDTTSGEVNYEPTGETKDKLCDARNNPAYDDPGYQSVDEYEDCGPQTAPGGIDAQQLPDATVSANAGGVEVSASPNIPEGPKETAGGAVKGAASGAVTEQVKPWSGVGPHAAVYGAAKGAGTGPFVEVDVDF